MSYEHHGRYLARHAPHAPPVGREDEGQGVDEVRCDDLHDPALLERFPDETHLERLEIPQAAMNELGGSSREVAAPKSPLSVGATFRPREGSPSGPSDASADHQHIVTRSRHLPDVPVHDTSPIL